MQDKKDIVVIDPGHGGPDPGGVGSSGLYESHVAWKIASMVADILMRHGIEIIFTREGDVRVSLDKRVQIANNAKADYFVSIHINSASNPEATGTETFAYRAGTEGDKLAHSIQKELVQAINLADRGVKYNSLKVVRETKMPAALVEVAFINNPKEEKLLKNDEFLERAAVGIAKGILKHLKIDYILAPPIRGEKSEEEKTKEWQEKQGLEHLQNLTKKGVIDTPDFWKEKILENMPVWAFLSLVDRITNK